MRVLVFQADDREPLEQFRCEWLVHPFLRKEDRFEVVHCLRETPKINLEEYDFFVITGSKFQAGENLPWIHYLLDQVKVILELEKPLLGICFGHQLLARALGAAVVENVKGIEAGTVAVELTSEGKAGRLFAGVPKKFQVFAYHYFEVKNFSGIEDVAVLAGNAHSKIQAFRYKDQAWGVQFHPEINLTRARKIISYRKEASDDRSVDYDALYKKLKRLPAGERIMKNFYSP
ncbi:type 1 glutamine amidotransferase [Candidatus Uhrbacteria bacterium]|nr:type 1 glutamine amidotransferase [Candidatus Uhrbacteria bacterium]